MDATGRVSLTLRQQGDTSKKKHTFAIPAGSSNSSKLFAASLRADHLASAAKWAAEFAPSLGPFLGSRLAATCEASSVPPPLSVRYSMCQRCESVLVPGISCSVIIRKRALDRRNTTRADSKPMPRMQQTVHRCNNCCFDNVKQEKGSSVKQQTEVALVKQKATPIGVPCSSLKRTTTTATVNTPETGRKRKRKGWSTLKDLSVSNSPLQSAGQGRSDAGVNLNKSDDQGNAQSLEKKTSTLMKGIQSVCPMKEGSTSATDNSLSKADIGPSEFCTDSHVTHFNLGSSKLLNVECELERQVGKIHDDATFATETIKLAKFDKSLETLCGNSMQIDPKYKMVVEDIKPVLMESTGGSEDLQAKLQTTYSCTLPDSPIMTVVDQSIRLLQDGSVTMHTFERVQMEAKTDVLTYREDLNTSPLITENEFCEFHKHSDTIVSDALSKDKGSKTSLYQTQDSALMKVNIPFLASHGKGGTSLSKKKKNASIYYEGGTSLSKKKKNLQHCLKGCRKTERVKLLNAQMRKMQFNSQMRKLQKEIGVLLTWEKRIDNLFNLSVQLENDVKDIATQWATIKDCNNFNFQFKDPGCKDSLGAQCS